MKSSKADVHARVHRIPTLRFEPEQQLTSYAGLVVFFKLFVTLGLKERLRRCFAHIEATPIFGHATIVLLLVVHLLLGFRRLRGLDYYRHDPLVARTLGLRHLPDVATVSRTLASADRKSVDQVRAEMRAMTLDRLRLSDFRTVTFDFDGSVQSTTGHAEGTAVGFNKVRRGARSYYPLFCTVAQTGQFFDLLHRSGNVHDSSGARDFLLASVREAIAEVPRASFESRVDAAFFSDEILTMLDGEGVAFTCSVPFERFPALKAMIEKRRVWETLDAEHAFFPVDWLPKSWTTRFRMLAIRTRRPVRHQGPLQLDLFEPTDFEHEYKVIVTNRTDSARSVMEFHNGRGSQERIFAEAKQHAALDLVPMRRRIGNELFTIAGLLAHNLTRELQARARPPARSTLAKRPARWEFLELGTIRQRWLHLAGRLTRPQGDLTLSVNDTPVVRAELTEYLDALDHAA